MKKISTIIPNYNNLSWLPKTLDSVLSQKGDFEQEIIVVDDHSEDGSWQLLQKFKEEYPNSVFIYKNEGKGGNAARNYGFSKSTGDYIQWLDSDDQLLPEKFETQSSYMEKHADVDIVYSDWRMDFYESGNKLREEVKIEKSKDSFLKGLILDEWNPNNSYLLRREFARQLHQLNAWNLNTRVAQDREYFTMAAIHGARFHYVPGVYSVYNRWSTTSVSGMAFKERLKLNLELEWFFMKQIQEQEWISKVQKRKLLSNLKTDALKACFYHPSLTIKAPIKCTEINWKRIHYKMRLIVPFIWLYQMFKYRIKNFPRL